MGRELAIPRWFDLGGPEGWCDEIDRQARIMRCRSEHYRRFAGTWRLLQPWRIRSSVQVPAFILPRILKMLEHVRRNQMRYHGERTGLSYAELGEMLMETRNRIRMAELGRDRARVPNPRWSLDKIPTDRLEALIQSHPNLALVDRLRTERGRRVTA